MIARLGAVLNRWASRWVPDPFVLAIFLTAFVAAAGALYMWSSGADAIAGPLALGWYGDFAKPGLLAFALQMCLILVTGHAMAVSPPVQRLIAVIARLPSSAAASTALVAFVACVSAFVHWGLGAIVGALLAREIGRHAKGSGTRLHYPLLGAAAYAGMAVWHGGLSGSAPLKVAECAGNSACDYSQWLGDVTLSHLLWGPLNLTVAGLLLVGIPLLFVFLTPKDEADYIPPPELQDVPEDVDQDTHDGLVERLQNSPVSGRVIGGIGLTLVAWGLLGPLKLDLNSVNLIFFSAAIALQGNLSKLVRSFADGARGAGAIIVQFPLYFGILGLMKASNLVGAVSDFFIEHSTETSFPLLTFLSAGLVNLFVPSGGGQWAIQSEILLKSGDAIGVDPVVSVMAFSYGDAWTNMLQPFWALPLLAIMGLKAKDIIGYTAMIFLFMGIVVPVVLLAF
jgi:short-chain fatty acids transporter